MSLHIMVCYDTLKGMKEDEVASRHAETLQIMDTLLDLFAEPGVLARWKYSDEQISWLKERLGPAVGAGRAPTTSACGAWATPAGLGRSEQAPFLAPLLCALLSPEYKLLPLARMLARAANGRWAAGDTIFVVSQDEEGRHAMGPLWQVISEPISDLGAVTVVVRGVSVQWIILERAWPAKERPKRSQFMPEACSIVSIGLEAPYDHMLKVQDKDIAYLNKGLDAWKARL